ncbi:Root meristem growth factor 9 [Spatholobus suberectus]|nr:Root meristem growth factor 9 [Spatholobus suberectus]
MAMLPSKRCLLVAFLLLCFVSVATARSLRETKDGLAPVSAEKSHENQFKPNQGGEQDIGDLATMDYTPAKKNPPIHN